MKRKWLVRLCVALLLLFVIIGLFFACSNWAWNSSFGQTEIKQGFSQQLLNELETRYGITIPEEAQFIKGYNCLNMRDNYVSILFECPVSETYEDDDHMAAYMKQLLTLGTRYSGASKDTPQFIGSEWYEELGGQMEWMLEDESIDYTYISYNIEANKLVIRFTGWRPGAIFP